MLDQLVGQVSRLFSAKKNRGKQVLKLTNKLHTLKQVIIGLSIALLLGDKAFREHFECQGASANLGKDTMTNFCLINGTTTVIQTADQEQSNPHVGLGWAKNGYHHKISHNYIRSLWVLLILIGICSYFPLRKWASMFENDTLQALLQLSGYEESKLVSAAEHAKPYEMLSRMSRELDTEKGLLELNNQKLPKNEKVTRKIAIVDDYHSIYNHKLDYYPNQLIYLLLTSNTRAYKSSDLKLRNKLICYSFCSLISTSMQFILPITFVGLEYSSYGWEYAGFLMNYLKTILNSHEPVSYLNTIDYELSAVIFPVATQCEYRQHALTGDEEKFIVQCTVAMNEICGKLFVIIWWIVVINFFIELWSLLIIFLGALNFKLTSFVFGCRYWPAARKQAESIASFRFRRAQLLRSYQGLKEVRNQIMQNITIRKKRMIKPRKQLAEHHKELTIREKKQIEAESHEVKKRTYYSKGDSYRSRKSVVRSCLTVFFSTTADLIRNIFCCLTSRRRQNFENEDERDIEIFFLFYLMYLRLGHSRSLVEEVIRMTSVALENYLDDLKKNCNIDSCNALVVEPDHEPNEKPADDVSLEEKKKLNKEMLGVEGATIVDVMM